jgi:hypothetical protein
VNSALTIALISATVSLLGAAYTAGSARATARLQHNLNVRLDEVTRQRIRQEQLAELVSRYREPLLLAAIDLQGRLYNILRYGFLPFVRAQDDEDRDYARHNTAFVLAQFFGWVEALRVDLQYLDPADTQDGRDLRRCLDNIRRILATDSIRDRRLRIFWGHQRAIGELMLATQQDDPATPGRRHCLGYAAFVHRLRHDAEFEAWFTRLIADVDSIAADASFDPERLTKTQHALVDLIDYLDPHCVRIPEDRRSRA